MADGLALAGLAYPIAKDFIKLAMKLKRLLEQICNATTELSRVIKRTKTVAQTYDFFRDTIKVARRIPDLAPMFHRHRELMKSINHESRRTINKLKHITRKFRSLICDEPVSRVDRWVAQFEWTRESKKTIPSLFQDMEVLERSMRTTGTLVHIQLLSQIYQKDGSDVVKEQVESLKIMLDIEFNKLRQAQEVQKKLIMQQRMSSSQHVEAEKFAQEIILILQREIPLLKNHQPAESRSRSDSRSSPTSRRTNELSPITTPSHSPSTRSESKTSVIELRQGDDVSSPKRKISRKRKTQSAPPHITSKLSPHFPFSSDTESEKYDRQDAGPEMHDQNAGQDRGGAYMQTAFVGPPKLVPRTFVGRPSPDRPDASI